MDFNNRRIFVSGGNGVIGNVLVEQLHQQGARLLVGDLKPRPAHWPADIQYWQGDLNYIRPEELDEFDPEYFFHLAATFERSTETYGFWHENYQHNVRLSNHLMSLLKDSPSLKKVIFASSYLIYDKQLYCFDKPAEKPYSLKETDPVSPRNLTGSAKLNHEIELQFLDEFRRKQFNTVSARIYRSYGRNSRDIISRWIRALLKGETITLFRKEGIFDYVFADDVAKGLILLAQHEQATGIYNLGSGNARRVEEIVAVLKQHFPGLQYEEAASDIPFEASQANTDKLFNETGWRPQTQVETAIPQMIEYEQNRVGEFNDELPSFSVLVTSISKKIPLLNAVKKACDKLGGNIRLIGGDVNSEALGKYFVDEFFLMPRLDEWSKDALLEYCKSKSIRLIIPTRDGELMYWAEMKTALQEAGIHILGSEPGGVNCCLDKLLFYTELIKKDIPAIATAERINDIQSPTYVVKERFGAGSLSIGLNLDKAAATAHAQQLTHPIFQPFIKGKEYSVDMYVAANGNISGSVCRTRDMVVNGESQVTTTCTNEGAAAVCAQVARQLQLTGHLVFQLLEDETGGIHVIECNCRFGGASSLSIAAGLDSFYRALLEATGNNLDNVPFTPSKKIIKQVRYPADRYITG